MARADFNQPIFSKKRVQVECFVVDDVAVRFLKQEGPLFSVNPISAISHSITHFLSTTATLYLFVEPILTIRASTTIDTSFMSDLDVQSFSLFPNVTDDPGSHDEFVT